MANYRQKAESMINPGLDAQLAAARSNLNSSLSNLDMSKGTINQKYADSESDTKRLGQVARNNANNSMLSKGMARSTIAGDTLKGEDYATLDRVNRLETAKAGDLSNVEMQKNLLNQNFGNTEMSLRADAEGKILSLADQLQARDAQLALQQRQQALAEANSRFERDMKQKEFDMATQSKAAKEQEDASKNKFIAAYYNIRQQDDSQARRFIEDNRDDIINRYGMDFYKQMLKEQDDYAQSEFESKVNLPLGGQMFGKANTVLNRRD
jgi:hypothetical protein